jgi:hypothetical protein
MQSKHNLFKYSLKEAIINLIKIKNSDQMFTACVCIGDCLIFQHIIKRKLLCMDFYFCVQNLNETESY